MSLKYHLVKRLDMRKEAPEGAKLLYGQVRAAGRVKLNTLCELISGYTMAGKGDVLCILQGLLFHMRSQLLNGNVIHLGEFGSFRMIAGSKGVKDPKKFHPSLFKSPKIVFTPGIMLRDTSSLVRFEKLEIRELPEDCKQEHAM